MQKYTCKVCGAELFWDPQAGALKCKYCDTEFQPTDFEDHTLNKEQKDESLDATYTNAGPEIGSDMVVYQCRQPVHTAEMQFQLQIKPLAISDQRL